MGIRLLALAPVEVKAVRLNLDKVLFGVTDKPTAKGADTIGERETLAIGHRCQ
jgi:hypothetical protein